MTTFIAPGEGTHIIMIIMALALLPQQPDKTSWADLNNLSTEPCQHFVQMEYTEYWPS